MELNEGGTAYGTAHANMDIPFAGQDALFTITRLLFTFESI